MSKLLRQIALVPDDNIAGQISASDIAKVAAALQRQATRDFGPIWDVEATVDGFPSLDDVPLGYWPIIVGQESQNGGGVHMDTKTNQPYALVDFTPDWTVTASHECLEMLADPYGNRTVPVDSPNPDRPGRVNLLVEVCDPCETPTLGYTVNGVRVSDFYTPRYVAPAQGPAAPATALDFQGHITKPLDVLEGGYLSWGEPSGEWFQLLYFNGKRTFRSIGRIDQRFGSLRAWVDSTSRDLRREALSQRAEYPRQVLVKLPGEHADDNNFASAASHEYAKQLREEIAHVRGGDPKGQ